MPEKRKNSSGLSLSESFQVIVEQSPVSTQIFAPNGDTIMVNKAWEKMWQIKSQDIIKSYNIFKDKQLVKRKIMPLIKQAFAGKKRKIPVIRYEPSETLPNVPAVAYRWVRGVIYPITDTKKQVAFVVLQHEDVTDVYEYQHKLQASEERFRQLLEHSADAITLLDAQGRRMYSTPSRKNILGYDTTDAIEQSVFRVIHPDDVSIIQKLFKNLAKKPKSSDNAEFRVKHKDGRWIWIHATGTNLLSVPNVEAIVINYHDITQRKQSEEVNARLASIVASSDDAVVGKTLDGEITSWNEGAEKLFGYSADEAVGKDIFLIIPTNLYDEEKNILARLKKGDRIQHYQTERRRKDGTLVPVSLTISPIRDSSGRIIGASKIARDITEQKRVEQQKSDFLSMASHELKTPLTSMKMFLELLERQLDLTELEQAKYFVSRIHDQTNQLVELTNDLLDVSRIETGKLRLNIEKFRLDDLIRETIEAITTSSRTHKLIISQSVPLEISADRYRIFQVLINLVTNAIKYSPSGKDIYIALNHKDNHAIVSVQDFGIGIKKNQQGKVFDRLYQVTDPQEKTYPGLGLGLYISKEIIERHKGKIWVKSKIGEGSTFLFSLPVNTLHTAVRVLQPVD